MIRQYLWVLTAICLAGVIDPGEVFETAALVRALCVVADMGTHSKLLTLILICEGEREGGKTNQTQGCEKTVSLSSLSPF